jgi:hypothetical protein
MTVESVSLSFPEFILKHCDFLKLNKSGNLTSRQLGPPPKAEVMWAEIKRKLAAVDQAELFKHYARTIEIDRSSTELADLLGSLRDLILKQRRESTERVVSGALSSEFSPELPVQLKDLIALKPCNRDDVVYLYDNVSDTCQPYTQQSLDFVVGRFPEEVRDSWYATNYKVVQPSYDPAMPRFYREDGSKHEKFNMYTPPDWRKDWIPDYSNSTLPEEVEFVSTHLLPNPSDRSYLFSWLRDMTFSRAEPILIFQGAGGVGKNLFLEDLAGALVGSSGTALNTHKAQRKFKESAFHGNLSECRLFILDEVLLDEDLKETLKDYHNGTAALEMKFENMTAPKRMHCSIAAMANEKSKFKLSYDDRKFYVPTLCNIDLKSIKSKEWITHYKEVLLKDPAYIRRIANYLHFHVESIQPPVKTPAFLELCWLAMPAYMHKFLGLAVAKRCFDEREFRRSSSKGPRVEFETLREKVGAFGRARQLGVEGVGKFQVHDSGWTFLSNIYRREDLLFKDESVVRLESEPLITPDIDPSSPLGAN